MLTDLDSLAFLASLSGFVKEPYLPSPSGCVIICFVILHSVTLRSVTLPVRMVCGHVLVVLYLFVVRS